MKPRIVVGVLAVLLFAALLAIFALLRAKEIKTGNWPRTLDMDPAPLQSPSRPSSNATVTPAPTSSAAPSPAPPKAAAPPAAPLPSAPDQKPKEGFVPDTETAIAVAIAVLKSMYGKQEIEGEAPFNATLKDGLWTVSGSDPNAKTIPAGGVRGVASITLAKDDGRVVQAGRATTSVTLQIEHNQTDLRGDPAFIIKVTHWSPAGEFSIYMVGPKGEEVALVPPEKSLRADENGSFSLTVPYEHKRLYRGKWVLLIAGPSGIHKATVEVPEAGRGKGRRGN